MQHLWPALAVGSQLAAMLVWLAVSIHFAPSVVRLMKAEGNPWDRAGAFAMITGLLLNGYFLRWVVLGQRIVENMPLLRWWVVANFAGIMLGLGSLFGFETAEVKRGDIQARNAIMLWAAMVVSCILLAWYME